MDYLRGVLALAVALYHFYAWGGGGFSAAAHGFVYRTGIYAVLMFYVISGVSFGYVYRDIRIDREALGSFWIKRYFRLAPLYWLALVATALMAAVRTGEIPGLGKVIMNVTLTFGALAPSAYMVTGGWSIGNEMFYYILCPFLILALRRSGWAFGAALAASVGLGGAYAFDWLTPVRALSDQWGTYIQPASHLFYFVAGVGLSALLIAGRRLRPAAGVALTAALVLLYGALAASDGRMDNIVTVTGWRWAAYSVLAIGIVGAVSLIPGALPGVLHAALSWLGRVSYSVYLLHPIVWGVTSGVLSLLDLDIPRVAVALPASLLAADVIYRFLEAPMVTLGRRVASAFGRRYRRPTANAPTTQW